MDLMARALRHPVRAWSFLSRGRGRLVRAVRAVLLARWTGHEAGEVMALFQELDDEGFPARIRRRKGPQSRGESQHGDVLYALCRLLRPRAVVETGVCSGVSSAYLLRALAENGTGHLHSVDLPELEALVGHGPGGSATRPVALVPEGKEAGWAVPEELRERWTLHRGRTRDLLPGVLEAVGPVDLFLHDSEHSYENMVWEYRTVWPVLRPGGWLVSDDVWWNGAFRDFAAEVTGSPRRLEARMGLLEKPP